MKAPLRGIHAIRGREMDSVRAVPCPMCNVGAGINCIAANGDKASSPHRGRVKAMLLAKSRGRLAATCNVDWVEVPEIPGRDRQDVSPISVLTRLGAA